MWVGSLSSQISGKEVCFNLLDSVKLKMKHIFPLLGLIGSSEPNVLPNLKIQKYMSCYPLFAFPNFYWTFLSFSFYLLMCIYF